MGCRACTPTHLSWLDHAWMFAEAQLKPYTSVRRCRIERLRLKNRNAVAARLGAAIALFSVINAFETGEADPLKWFRKHWQRTNKQKGN